MDFFALCEANAFLEVATSRNARLRNLTPVRFFGDKKLLLEVIETFYDDKMDKIIGLDLLKA